MSIENLSLKQAQDKMQAKQAELSKVFEEAKTESGELSFGKVKCLGDSVKGALAVAEEVKKMNAELDELGRHVETLSAAEKAARDHEAREKGLRNFPLPGAGGGQPANIGQFKSLGERVIEAKEFKAWQGSGAAGGLSLNFDEYLPSDFLAKAAQFETMGSKALMTRAAGFAPESLRLPGFVEAATRPIQLLDILPMGKVSQAAVPYMEETTCTHAAAETAEGADFAESTFVFTERTVPVQKITDSLPVTDEQLEDVALIESYINARLAFGVRQRLDGQCLNGNGTAPNLRGILNTSGIQTRAKGTDPVMDAIYKAMTGIRVTGRAIPTHILLNPLDWQDIRLTKTTEGIYLYGSPAEAGPERLWGLPIVQADALAENTGLVGSFDPAWIMLFERRGIDIQVGFTGTQFTAGRRTVRADMRAALVVMRPAAFHTVTGI
ncbi:MAG: phage major capsid protein [Erythrobacter sp.]